MRIALGTAALQPVLPLEGLLPEAARAGFQAVELAIGETGPLTYTTAQEMCVRLAAQAAKAGVTVSGLFAIESAAVNLAAPSPAARQLARDRLAAALERAAWLGAGVVAFAPVILGETCAEEPAVRYEKAYSRTLEAMLELRFEAQRRAVRLALMAGRNRFLLSPLETRGLIDQINSPWVGVGLDLADVLPLGSPDDWISSLGHRLARVGVRASASGQSPVAPSGATGMSPAAWSAMAAALRRARYAGAVTVSADDLPAALRLAAALREAEQSAGA